MFKIRNHIKISGVLFLSSLMFSCSESKPENKLENNVGTKYVLVIHGGAGTIEKDKMTPELEKQYTDKLTEALQAGYQVLQQGKSSLDAVQAAIHVMEDSPLFNAGKGAVFTHNGKNEMDASIMDGKTLKAGAVANVGDIKNPIDAARAVMDKSPHVMMAGKGAEEFAQSVGITTVPPSYFFTQKRWDELQEAIKEEGDQKHVAELERQKPGSGYRPIKQMGTVGCVALDHQGNIAAGTSTGGMTNKRFGRIGDSPIIGAGTYANNLTAGISNTGWGEFYIREVAAKRISDLIELKGLSLKDAVAQTLAEIGKMGGDGGIIALNKKGEYSQQFNTEGMYRGAIDEHGRMVIKIYK